MSDFAALWYLESRRFVNHVRRILTSPLRVAAWSIGIGWAIFMIVMRSLAAARHEQHAIAEPFASAAFFAAVSVASFPLLYAALGKVAAFDSVADARFLVGSALHERNVLFWLQLRNSVSLFTRLAVFAIIVILSPSAVRPVPTIVTSAAFCLVVVSGWIPMVRLRTVFGQVPGVIVALAIAACGVIPLALLGLGWIDSRFEALTRSIEALGAGHLLASMVTGNYIPVAALLAFAAILLVLATFTARDLYPELYLASLSFFETGRAMGSQRARSRITERETATHLRVTSSSSARGWNGGFAIVWRDWLVATRQRLAMVRLVGWPLAAVACAVVFGAGMNGKALALGAVPGITNAIIIAITMYSSTSFANDVGKPLWWLSDAGLRQRLYATLVSKSWFLALCIAIALTLTAALRGHLKLVVPAILVAIVTAFLLRACAIMLYAIFPSQYDQRGPIALVRLFVVYMLFVPIASSWIIAFVLTQDLLLTCAIGTAASAIETVALIESAAIRLRGAGAAIARAEQAE